MNFFLFSISLISFLAFSQIPKMEDVKVINGVTVGSVKVGKVRHYQGEITQEYDVNIDVLFNSVMDFESRCNNDFKDKRKHFSKDHGCRHHNKNMIETVIVQDIKPVEKKEENEVDRFIMKRYIYNREAFEHNELAKVYRYKNSDKLDEIKLDYRMISDDEAKKYIDKTANKESVFINVDGLFILTKLSASKTKLYYRYYSSTDHWLLNKSMVVGEFFENMSNNMKELFSNFQADVTTVKKE